MSLAEVFLRIGGALGGLIIVAAHALVLALLPAVDCDPATGEPWRGTLVFAVLAGLALPLLGLARPWATRIRWFALALAPVLLYDAFLVLPYLETTFSGTTLCALHGSIASGDIATGRERAWAAVQLLVLAGGLLQITRYWRPGPVRPESPGSHAPVAPPRP